VTRLSTSDGLVLSAGELRHPLYVGSLSILRQPRAGLSYEALLSTVETAAAERAAVPPEGPRSDDAAGQAGVGSTTATSTSLTTSRRSALAVPGQR